MTTILIELFLTLLPHPFQKILQFIFQTFFQQIAEPKEIHYLLQSPHDYGVLSFIPRITATLNNAKKKFPEFFLEQIKSDEVKLARYSVDRSQPRIL